jgi:hypothetical protein
MRLVRALIAVLGVCGCGGPTSLGLDVSLSGGLAEPDSLRVTLYGAGRLGTQTAPLASAGKRLPGRLVVTPVDAGTPGFRWLLEGLDPLGAVMAQAAAATPLAAGRETDVAALLAGKLQDTDGDGVPDVIDDCPSTPDPMQNCAAPRDLGAPGDGGVGCPPAAILCEDFESGSFMTNGWTIGSMVTGDTVVIDNVRPHSGALAMHGSGLSLSQSHHAAIDHSLSTTQTIAVRQWIYLAKPPGPFSFYLQLYTPTIGASIGTDDLGNWVLDEDLNSTTANDHTTTIATPVGAWTCIELVATQSGGAQRLQAYADNQLLLDIPASQTYAFTDLFIGAARIPQNSAAEVFLDDVAVAPTRIGCN